MKYALWIVQILLALAFISTGFMKLFMPLDQLATNMVWVSAVPLWLVRVIGLAELAGGLGLVLPAATRIQPILTPVAAAALALDMAFAAFFHLLRGEFGNILPVLILCALSAFVAYGRWKLLPIAPRGSTTAATVAAQ